MWGKIFLDVILFAFVFFCSIFVEYFWHEMGIKDFYFFVREEFSEHRSLYIQKIFTRKRIGYVLCMIHEEIVALQFFLSDIMSEMQ